MYEEVRRYSRKLSVFQHAHTKTLVRTSEHSRVNTKRSSISKGTILENDIMSNSAHNSENSKRFRNSVFSIARIVQEISVLSCVDAKG